MNTIKVSKSLDPQFVWPDIGPNCYEGYQQMTLVGKELNIISKADGISHCSLYCYKRIISRVYKFILLSDENQISQTLYSILLPLEKSASRWTQEITCDETKTRTII